MGAEQSQLEQLASNFKDFRQDYITFFVNGKEQTVKTNGCDPEISPNYLLVDYLRDKLGLTGTKYMCREGGCGACIVTVKSTNASTGSDYIRSANACLLPVYACDGYEITTVEALGNRRAGYSPIQERLVEYSGTQCGFCTPGLVMNMYSVAQSNPQFTAADVEYSFDGNICRCTGYRPIIDAFRSLSTNPSPKINFKCSDIEDTYKCPLKGKDDKKERMDKPSDQMELIQLPRNLHLRSPDSGEQWIKVTTLDTLYDVLKTFSTSRIPYRLVAGNTGTGIFKEDGPYQGFIDINDVPELHYTSLTSSGIVLGGSTTITTAIDILDKASNVEGLVYAREFFDHFRRVAGLAVRNQGTLSGNLMLKHQHREFTSDIFILLESIGATLTIGSSPSLMEQRTLLEFLDMDMTGRIILSIHLPSFDHNYIYKCYKLGKRYQNAISYVNAGMLFNIDPSTFTIMSRPRICFGGINSNFIHARATEKYLKGKPLTMTTLQGALAILKDELVPDSRPEMGSREYRLGLAQSYLYRFFLSVKGPFINRRLQSGSDDIARAENKGIQVFDTDKKLWPLTQPIPKLAAMPQTTGEAEYINDIRPDFNELFGVFVVSTVANAKLALVDPSKALMVPGVVAFISAEDIPGNNNYAPFSIEREEIFAEVDIKYAGQSIGLLVAINKYIAFEARSKVIVKYEDVQKPLLEISGTTASSLMDCEADLDIKAKNFAFPCRGLNEEVSKQILKHIGDNDDKQEETLEDNLQDKVLTVKGEFRTRGQYHFHMETQICLCVPNENGLDVYSSTQHMDAVQIAIAGCLRIPNNSIQVHVRRLGGGFGAKISKAPQIACAAALASHLLHKPVRVAMDLETNMDMIGKRLPYLVKYDAKVDGKGKILKLTGDVWCDTGHVGNEPSSLYGMICMQSCYKAKDWNLKPRFALTNTATNTFTRSPGSAQGTAAIETIMEHIAHTVKRDPLEVRITNYIRKGDTLIGVPGAKLPTENLLPGILDELKSNGEYESRKQFVESFNQNNRWRKRGLSIVNQRFANHYQEFRLPAFISVYHADGTVNVSHGGIEMGQGINTKVAQVVAYTLQIPLDTVKVQPANNLISPNTSITAGSVTSELCCSAARRACELLLEKLAPVRKELGNPTWQQLITAANAREILLTSQFQHMNGELISYDIWSAALIEVEVDVLTGDFKIIRVDIIEDAGRSLSPLIDVGQVEGALIMGLGWWTTEELVYDQDSGQLLTNNTFGYKPMLPADIPEDLRVTLLRNAPNPYGVLSSKATAEPPLNMGCGVLFALRQAINSARNEVGNHDWYQMDGPVTREVVRKLCLTSTEQFTL